MYKKILFIVALLLLTGCNGSSNTLQTHVSEKKSTENIFLGLESSFFDDAEFMQCSKAGIDSCIQESFGDSISLELCDTFILESNRKSCKNNFLLNKARTEKNEEQCEKVEDIQACKYEIIIMKGIEQEAISGCAVLSQEYQRSCRNYLLNYLAQNKKDIKLCEDIEPEFEGDDLKQGCKQEVEQMLQE